jgi:hypothetical protein
MLMPAWRTNAHESAPCDLGSDSPAMEELRQQNRELQERVEELGALASTIVHDFKGSFGDFSGELQEDYVLLFIKQQQDCLDHLMHAIDKVNSVIDELLLPKEPCKGAAVMEPVHMAFTLGGQVGVENVLEQGGDFSFALRGRWS